MNPAFLRALLASLCMTVSMAVTAQSFPTKPVRFIVPFPPGGSSDVIARVVGQKLSERWGQPVVIENKTGAATTIASDFVAKAPADGHTILLAAAAFVTTQYAYPKLPYDTRRDFVPVSLLVTLPLVLVVNPSTMNISSIGEFVTAAKKSPGKLTYGSSGNGSLPHLAMELFRMQSGIDVVHVPYKGGVPAVIDLVGGQLNLIVSGPLEVMPNVKAGRLRVVGISSATRASYWPEVPTFKESGYRDYEAYAWFGVLAAAATPKDVLAKLNADIVAALKSPGVAERLAPQGLDLAGTTAEEFGRFLALEHARWSAVVKAANVVVE